MSKIEEIRQSKERLCGNCRYWMMDYENGQCRNEMSPKHGHGVEMDSPPCDCHRFDFGMPGLKEE